jgi:hypothetical protein
VDGQVIAHVSMEADEGTRAGVMFRNSVEADAAMAAALVYPDGEVRLNRRPVEGYVAAPEGNGGAKSAWVRLARAGEKVTAYRSKEGRFWQPVTSATVPLSEKVLAGLAVSTGANNRVTTATFDHVRVIPGTPAATYFDGATGPARGIVMVDGTMLAGSVDFVEAAGVKFWPRFDAQGKEMATPKDDGERKAQKANQLTFPLASVARVLFAPEPPELEKLAPVGVAGALLMSGDFVEGEVERLGYAHTLDLKSVLFGSKRMETNREVICAVLRGVAAEKGKWEVRVKDGSVIEAEDVAFEGEVVSVKGVTVGVVKVPVGEVLSVEAAR